MPTALLHVFQGGRRIESLQRHVHNLRSIKSKGEIEIMAEAGRISSLAFIEVYMCIAGQVGNSKAGDLIMIHLHTPRQTMRATRPGVSEHEVRAVYVHGL